MKLFAQKADRLAVSGSVLVSFSLICLVTASVGISQETGLQSVSLSNVTTVDELIEKDRVVHCEVEQENPKPAETSPPSLFRHKFASQIQLFNNVVSHLDSQIGRINSLLAKVLFYDFGTSEMTQFGAADIPRQAAKEYFGDQQCDFFATQIPAVLSNFHDRYERMPFDLSEAKAALVEAGLKLPEVPMGIAYAYDNVNGEFMVEPHGLGIPFIAAWLLLGGAFLTLRMRLINLRGLFHALALISGKYDSSNKIGQLNHFRTFTTSLASTVGLGAISGVAIAVCIGGPGGRFLDYGLRLSCHVDKVH